MNLNFTGANVSSTNRSALGDASNGVSVLVCLVAAILVIGLKLHKIVVYRLALYQVLAAMALATDVFVQALVNPEAYGLVCTAMGWFLLYSEWMKLLFTMWVTFHLFCFAVLHKNLKKLEVLYVVTSLLVPAVIACVPFTTQSYGRNPDGTVCYIYITDNNTDDALIERLALWDCPTMVILLLASTAIVVMVINLAHLIRRRATYKRLSEPRDDQFWKALKQLLPLVAFPVLFMILEIPVLVYHVYVAINSTLNEAVLILPPIAFSLWNTSSGASLIIHISVVHMHVCSRRTKYNHAVMLENATNNLNPSTKLVSESDVKSATYFSVPSPSV